MNAIGYLRLSMKDQSRYSLEFQEAAIRQYCERYKINLIAIFKDNGQCSDNFDRPDYIALEKFIKEQNGRINYLIVMCHDRFSRNLPEALMKIKSLEDKFGLKVLATEESPEIDSSDPDVFLNRAFKYLMANSELLRIRQRTSRSIRQALESGRFVNKAPYGYINKKQEGQRAIIVPDSEKAVIIKKIFSDFLLGHPLSMIHKEAMAIGYTGKSKSAIPRLLSNCVYAGLVKLPETANSPERYIKGIHQGIVTELGFWRCQELLGNRKPQRCLPDEKVPLRGILKHSCGSHMTAGYSKGKRKHYLYYRCVKCSHVNESGDRLHNKLSQILENLSLTDTQVERLSNSVKEKLKMACETQKAIAKKIQSALKDTNNKLESLEEKLINGMIENQTYKKWYKKLSIEKSKLQAQLNGSEIEQNSFMEKAIKLIPFLTDLNSIFQKATIQQKHLILKEVFKGGIAVNGGVLRTPYLHPALSHNELILNKKGLLFVEQSFQKDGKSTVRSEIGS
ncbi:MAG: recombinase family protein [Chitinophagaceae bacterium]|nr:MAG: recombinase family protein [Chitinophagaceae bacterium]